MTTPETEMWVAQRLVEAKEEQQIGILSTWVHNQRQAEVTQETIEEINNLSDQDAVEALNELRMPRRYIRKQGQSQMNISVLLQALSDGNAFRLKALLDSGCTGSCIDKEFVKKNDIRTKKVPRPIPVYNADGMLNEGGPITEFVEMRMVIQDHVERIQLAVANLGKMELFIGHEWLKKHNPSVGWKTSALTFDRCPEECNYITSLNELEEDHDHKELTPEETERPFSFEENEFVARQLQQDKEYSLNPEDPDIEEQVPSHYHEYKNVFSKREFDGLPER